MVLPGSEYSGAYAHHCCPFFNGYFKIVRHAHGQYRDLSFRKFLFHFSPQPAAFPEYGARLFRFFIRRHTHQAFHAHMRARFGRLHGVFEFFRGEPLLALLSGNIEFQKNVLHLSRAFRFLVDFLQDLFGVTGLDEIRTGYGFFYFVLLQMSL